VLDQIHPLGISIQFVTTSISPMHRRALISLGVFAVLVTSGLLLLPTSTQTPLAPNSELVFRTDNQQPIHEGGEASLTAMPMPPQDVGRRTIAHRNSLDISVSAACGKNTEFSVTLVGASGQESTTIDVVGSRVLGDLADGDYKVTAERRGWISASAHATLRAGMRGSVLLRAEPLMSVQGTVVDASNSHALTGAQLVLDAEYDTNGETVVGLDVTSTLSQADGGFCIPLEYVTASSVRVHVHLEGFVDTTSSWTKFEGATHISLGVIELVPLVNSGVVLEGRVLLGDSNTPVANASLRVIAAQEAGNAAGAQITVAANSSGALPEVNASGYPVMIDSNGAYRIIAGKVEAVTIIVRAPGMIPFKSPVTTLDPSRATRQMDVRLYPGATIHGHVYSKVEVQRVTHIRITSDDVSATVAVDYNEAGVGAYRSEGWPDGRITVEALSNEVPPGITKPACVRRVNAQIIHKQDLEQDFHVGSGLVGSLVVGAIKTPSLLAAERTVVNLYRDVNDKAAYRAWCDADGRFLIGEVDSGAYYLFALCTGEQGAALGLLGKEVRVEANGTLDLGSLVITSNRVDFQCGGDDGQAKVILELTASGADAALATIVQRAVKPRTRQDGSATVFGLPHGQYVVTTRRGFRGEYTIASGDEVASVLLEKH